MAFASCQCSVQQDLIFWECSHAQSLNYSNNWIWWNENSDQRLVDVNSEDKRRLSSLQRIEKRLEGCLQQIFFEKKSFIFLVVSSAHQTHLGGKIQSIIGAPIIDCLFLTHVLHDRMFWMIDDIINSWFHLNIYE